MIGSYLSGTAPLAERGTGDDEALAKIVDGIRQAAGQAIRAGNIPKPLRHSIARHDMLITGEDIGTAVEETLVLAELDNKGLEITFRFENTAPAASALINRTQIGHVLVNLVRNAVEAVTGTDRREVKVPTGTDLALGILKVAVSETEPGVAPEFIEALFTPFVSTKRPARASDRR